MAKPGTLRPDHHVVSADGTRYVVRYVAMRTYDGVTEEQADLYPVDGGERLSLPTSELKRVVAMKLPPITGLPSERPRCPMCDTPLKPHTDHSYDGMQRRQLLARTFKGWRGYWISGTDSTDPAKFCTMNCAYKFARLAYKAGYRISRKDTKEAKA